MSPTESQIMHEIQLEASRMGCRLFRNNVGEAYAPGGGMVKFGLAVGSADLIGWAPITIGPEHVGMTLAVFLSVETKKPKGKTAPERLKKQQKWRDAVKNAGGLANFSYSVEDFRSLLAPLRLPHQE